MKGWVQLHPTTFLGKGELVGLVPEPGFSPESVSNCVAVAIAGIISVRGYGAAAAGKG
jgi:hypothetical protein